MTEFKTNLKPFRPVIVLWYLFFIVYLTIDFFRVFFDNSKFLLIFVDFFIILIFIYIFFNRRIIFNSFSNFPIYVVLSLFAFVAIIFFQLFNFYQFNFFTNLLGFRTYILPIFGIFVGFEYFLSKTFYQLKIQKFLLIILFFVVGFSIFQILIDTSKLGDIALSLVTSREHTVHSFEDQNISLTSSFFASGKKFGRFLILLYLVYSGVRLNLKKNNIFFVFFVFLVGLIASGSREAIYAFVFINVFSFFKFSSLKNYFLILLVSFIFLLVFVFVELDFESFYRLNFLLALGEDFGNRIVGLLPFTLVNYSNDLIFFGIGLGKYGQEAILVPEISELGEMFLSMFFDSNYSNIISDSGILKILIEIGLIGLIFYLILIFSLIYLSLRILLKVSFKDDRVVFNMCIYILLWIFFFLKAHSILSDVFLTFHLYFAVGYLSAFIKQRKLFYV